MASNLFNLVARAKDYARRNLMAREAARKLETSASEYKAGRKTRWQLEQDLNTFQQVVGQDRLNQFEQSGGLRSYGVSDDIANAMRRLTQPLGQIGNVIQGFFDRRSTGYQARQVQAAVELLQASGLQSMTNLGSNDQGMRRSAEAAMEALEDHGWSVEDTIQTMDEANTLPLEEITPDTESRHQSGRRSAMRDERSPTPARLSRKHFTPQSSNVFSFQYDYLTSTLYVCFKAPQINSQAVTNYTGQGGMRQMAGDMGKTITGKTNEAGPLYAYFDVPIKIYRLLIEAQSAGKAVWDRLRVRGTVWGHQFRYSLVSGVEVPGEKGEMAHYVPRRAVSGGFRSRSVAIPGEGPRRYAGSTLPQDMRGHREIARMRHQPSSPNRGRPNPPNRGR